MEPISFKNELEFIKHYSDDATCRRHLEWVLWKGTPVCPHCKSKGGYKLNDGKTYKCNNSDCYKKFTVTVGTVFENTKLGLPLWFHAGYLMTSHKKGISSYQLATDLGITQKSAWFVLHRLREMMRVEPDFLTEQSLVFEVDETYVGGREANKHKWKRASSSKGRSVSFKVPVVGILQRGGNIYTRVVKDTTKKSILPLIKEKVPKNATVSTDEYRTYSSLSADYKHVVVNHQYGTYVDGVAHTNGCENFWSLFKRGLNGIYHHVSAGHLDRYCSEYSFRYNTRKEDSYSRLNYAMAQSSRRLRYKDLVRSKMIIDSHWLTLKEVAMLTGWSRTKIWMMRQNGSLRCMPGKPNVVAYQSVIPYLK